MRSSTSHGIRFAEIDRFVEREYIANGRLAGAQLAISQGGAVHEACFGHLDRERSRPMVSDAMFRIFSMTKPLTCVAFMTLVEEGRVNLEDPVSRYIPAWSNLRLADGRASRRPMRVVDLLCHTSGLTYGIQYRTEIDARYRSSLSMRSDGQTLEEFIGVLSRMPLEFEPGTAWNYSVATDVLGYVIERITGQPFDEFLRMRILQPLGMTDTAFYVSSSNRRRLAECYVRRPDEQLGLPGPSFEGDLARKPRFFSGGGGLISTIKDYLSFCNLIVRRGKTEKGQLLSQTTLGMMSRNYLPGGACLPAASTGLFSDAEYAGIGFGLGWATTVDKSRSLMPGNPGDTFWSGMANTFFWCDPSRDVSCVFMTQLLPTDAYPLQRQIKTLVYDLLGERAAEEHSVQAIQ